MNQTDQQSTLALRRKKQRFMVIIASCGVGATVIILVVAGNLSRIDGRLGFAIIVALAFNAIMWLVRWSLTGIRRRIFLVGQLPMAVGVARLSSVVAITFLVLVSVAGLIVGGPFGGIALRALILGLLCFAILSFAANGLLNAIVVFRQFRGTLEATSRETAQNARQ